MTHIDDARPPGDSTEARVFGTRPPRESAEALVRRRINTACREQREGADWRERFELRPVLQRRTPNHDGPPYWVRVWGVYLDDGRALGTVVTNYYGDRLRFLPYGGYGLEPESQAQAATETAPEPS